jgi:hypothetical protein
MSTSSQREAQASVPPHVAQSTDLKRRRFLLALSAGGAGAAAVATQPLVTAVSDPAPAPAADSAKGYRETEHVRDYYATTRI